MTVLIIDESLVKEASRLDASSLNRSNIAFSRLSMKIADSLCLGSPYNNSKATSLLSDLEETYEIVAEDFRNRHDKSPPFCVVEGLKYAINAQKMALLSQNPSSSTSPSYYVRIVIPFYCEFERGMPASEENNPNGEESPIQKLEEAIFLLKHYKNNTRSKDEQYHHHPICMELLFVNDVIAEKTDQEQGGGSSLLFQKAIQTYLESHNMPWDKKIPRTDGITEGFSQLRLSMHNNSNDKNQSCILCITFTSCEQEIRDTKYETAVEKRIRMENRNVHTNKLQERKGGAVLTGMEMDSLLPLDDNNKNISIESRRMIRCLVDGDSAHPMGSFVGDAAYAILVQGHAAYLGDLKHPCTCVSTITPTVVDEHGKEKEDVTTIKIQNRKLMFSGFIVPFLFPELADTYQYRGTIQLPIKAFRGDVDFARAKLRTVQPNVDLGMLGLLCSHLNQMENDGDGNTIGSGPVTIRDNIASSTMTTSDLESEWTKTYAPIFTSAVSLCRDLKPNEFQTLDPWWTHFIENMELRHYVTLFGEDAITNKSVINLFEKMKDFARANDRGLVLHELKVIMEQIFAN